MHVSEKVSRRERGRGREGEREGEGQAGKQSFCVPLCVREKERKQKRQSVCERNKEQRQTRKRGKLTFAHCWS